MRALTLTISLIFLILSGCSNGSDDNSLPATLPLGAVEGEVELEIRNGDQDNYVQATYSFFHATRDDENLTRNGWELLLSQGQDGIDGKDFFYTEMVVGDIGIIEDLGAMSCKTIALVPGQENTGEYQPASEGGYPHVQHRENAPNFWFRYTDVHNVLLDSRNAEVEVNEGHCYAIRQISYDRETMAIFRVKEHNANSSVTLDEIEVFERKWR